MNYESTVKTESKVCPGVRLTVRRISFGNRLDLIRQVKDLLGRMEFLAAGEQGPSEEAEAAVLASEIDCEYLRWGLEAVDGLEIDGQAATPGSLIEKGPEALVTEAVELVRREAGLSEDERKTPSRIPFQTRQPGRVEMRRMPAPRPGTKTKMRVG